MKRKLLFAVLCIVSAFGCLKAADLPTSGSAEVFVKNVGTGTFLKGDCYWGTKACVWDDPYAMTITYISDGVYRLQSQQNNGGELQFIGSGDDPYVDSGATNLTFTEVDAVNHYYTINNGTGNLYAKPVTEDGADLYIVMSGDVSTDYAKWQIVSRAELVAALDAATNSNPIDATFFIKDAGIDVKSVNASSWSTTNVDLGGGGNAGHSAESWNKSSFTMSQTVTGLPNGKYRATCHGYYRWNSGTDNNNAAAVTGHGNGSEVLNAIFFAGTRETPLMSVAGDDAATSFCSSMSWADNTPNNQWQAAACFTKGYYLNTIDDIVVTDGNLTIGVKKTTQAGTDWAVFDEFKLFYLGEDLSIYISAYHDAVDAANAVNQSAPMMATALTALQSAISSYGTGVNEEDKDALLTATSALGTATSNATASIAAYAPMASVITEIDAVLAAAASATVAADDYNAIKTAYTNGTIADGDIAAKIIEAYDAIIPVIKSQTAASANFTYAIQNHSFEYGNMTGWNVDASSDTGVRETSNGTYAATGSDGKYLFNTWWKGNPITQSVTGLPNGEYTLTVSVSSDGATIYLKANGEHDGGTESGGAYPSNNVFQEASFTFLVTDGTATIGVVGGADGTAGEHKDYVEDGYWWYKADNFRLVKNRDLNVEEARSILTSLIATATTIDDNSLNNVGYGVFQITHAAEMTFYSAISAATTVKNDGSATVDDLNQAISDLNDAIEAYADAEVNAPAVGKKYYIKVATSGHAKENNAIVIAPGASSANNPTGYTLNASSTPEEYLAQAFTFTKVSDNNYNISIALPEGETYLTYGSLNGSAAGWKNQQIQATTTAANKGTFKIVATYTKNVFKIYNTVDNNYIDCQDGGNIYTDTGIEKELFSVAEASQASVPVNLAAGKYGTRIFPFTPSAIDGITYYSCETVNGSDLKMDEVAEPAANTPYIIYASKNVDETLEGWGTAATETYKTGLLTGIYNSPTIAAGANNYVLQTLNDTQAFYLVKEDFTNTQPYRAYITYEAPGDVKVLNFVFDELPTSINGIEAAQNENAVIYNLAGQRLHKTQKGVNIVNGKKILVK